MTPPELVRQLVQRFSDNRDAYESPGYKEAQLREEFINPFFEALGWDVQNRSGHAEAYKDVIHEDAIKIGGFTKAPDYSFRVGGRPAFFVEGKKPAVRLKTDEDPAFQLRRYAWSAKLPVSILTNFEEFAIYDTRIQPKKGDKASVARLRYYEFSEYEEKWDEIAGIISRDALLKGALDRFVQSKRAKRGSAEVDQAFLAQIEEWRAALARNLALRNVRLEVHALNFAVQRIIDRIVFLRICEDRGIEEYGQLQALENGANVYARLKELFWRADERYNSGLFHFRAEKDRSEPPDELTGALRVDDGVLKEIVRGLYYPESPFEFSVLPADILGQVYEQFLGKVIRLTEGHHAKVEDKPEVKKAGGVYYTPTYIVEYIVKETVGKLLEGRTPREAARVTVLDPACGSGTFLITAYQHLLDWHRDWYVKDGPEKHGKQLFQGPGGAWRLTTSERKRILLNSIYGVDIDPQAVEVTKLSLLLRVLEGESADAINQQLKFFHERALPDLAANVKCGNSLIGPEFYRETQLTLLPPADRDRVNAFDWEAAFPTVFGRSTHGFDAVIGNPPYIRVQTLSEWAPLEVEFYKSKYRSASQGNFDIYVAFVERALDLLDAQGRLGFILPHKFFNAAYGRGLRRIIAAGRHLAGIVHFGDAQVFSGATTYTCLLFLTREPNTSVRFTRVADLDAWRNGEEREGISIPSSAVGQDEWVFGHPEEQGLLTRLRGVNGTLGGIAARIAQGIRTSANEVYVLDVESIGRDVVRARSEALDRVVTLEREITAPFLQGRDIHRFELRPSKKVVLLPYQVTGGQATLIDEPSLRRRFPRAYEYLRANKALLEAREDGRMRGARWYGYVYPKNIELMRTPKIMVPDIAKSASGAWDRDGAFAFASGYAILLRQDVRESPAYVLGLLNSRVLDFYVRRTSTPLRGGFFRYFTQFLEPLPIPRVDFRDRAAVTRHDNMVALVDETTRLKTELAGATVHQRDAMERHIQLLERQLDELAYLAYGLADADIRMLEGPRT